MAEDDDGPKEELNWPLLIGVVLGSVVGLMFLLKLFTKSRSEDQFRQCELNVRLVKAATQMYAEDHGRRYAPDLQTLVKSKYLEKAPVCPIGGEASYRYETQSNPEIFSIYCSGGLHAKLHRGSGSPQTYPSFLSEPVTAVPPKRR